MASEVLQKKYTVSQLAEIAGAELIGDGTGEICRAAPFESATPDSITFVSNENLLKNIAACKAGAVIVSKKIETSIPLLVVKNVEKALIAVLKEFTPKISAAQIGIHKNAIVEQGAVIAPTASIGEFVCVRKGAVIGERTIIKAGCKVGENSVIGDDCRIDDNVVIYHNCKIGNHCIISANSVIGSTGFGYYFFDGGHQLIPHTGGVVIEDCVEIGANACVDRAKFGNTIIGAGTKVDNLVHIAHNVVIGKCCLIAGQVGIAGSTKLGNGVVLAGQVGIKDHIVIGDGVQVGAQAGVMNDIPAGKQVLGAPAIDIKDFAKQVILTRKLPEINKELKQLIKRIEILEAAANNS
ncbi:MAG TPA: UDP-3-O-(3-hydroxymyristoyl)glucosamine N-acyltransferase [Phycisphaerales bacterium]|nr:UDP-3-O-(3-hydroxymyristoyl)glucosamine N-acyltransferase [Phycisphaerales bacterium]